MPLNRPIQGTFGVAKAKNMPRSGQIFLILSQINVLNKGELY
jgi:hypothetical protein